MSKKIVVAVFFLLALFFCYRVEQKVYQTKTYSFYKNVGLELPESESVNSTQVLEKEVMKENLIAEEDKKIAYLTFDDGPSNVTEEVLRTLEEKNVNATFFLIGNQINQDTIPILKQSVEDGNCIGIHTYCHECNEIYSDAQSYIKDFEQAYEAIKDNLGIEPKIFRFPWGSANGYLCSFENEVITELEGKGFTYFDWNVSAEDSVGNPTESSIMTNIQKDYKKYNHPILLMHDSSVNSLTAQVLPQIIDELKEAGYSFDTLDHMKEPYQYPRD